MTQASKRICLHITDRQAVGKYLHTCTYDTYTTLYLHTHTHTYIYIYIEREREAYCLLIPWFTYACMHV